MLKTPDSVYTFSYEVAPGDCIFDEVDSNIDFEDVRPKAWSSFFKNTYF